MFDDMGRVMGVFFDGGIMMWVMMTGGMILILLLTIWTYQDAQRLGENAALWALVVFFTMGVGLIGYAIVRNPDRSYPSASASSLPPQPLQKKSSTTVTYSPPTQYNPKTDGGNIGGYCENCGVPLALTDSFCHKCGNAVERT